jgi:hypothetical protein
LTAVPDAARRRALPPHSRGRILADARAIATELPYDAGPAHVERAALRMIRRAAQDEFAREGVTHLQLPPAWGRMELREADIPSSPAFESFVAEVAAAITIGPSRLDREDALELRDRPASSDGFGLSLEAAADLASYLLHQAWLLRRVEERSGGAADGAILEPGTALPADTGDEQAYLAGRAAAAAEEVRGTLTRQVTVPLELRTALERHREITSERAPATAEGRRAGAAETGASRPGRPLFSQQAQAAISFAQSGASRATAHALRTGAVKAYELFDPKHSGTDQDDQRPQGPGTSR